MADSGAAGLENPTTSRFDMVILDMVMPGMSGVELIENIKRTFPGLKAKCVVVIKPWGSLRILKRRKMPEADGYIIESGGGTKMMVKGVVLASRIVMAVDYKRELSALTELICRTGI